MIQGNTSTYVNENEILARILPNERIPLYWKDRNKKFTIKLRERTKGIEGY